MWLDRISRGSWEERCSTAPKEIMKGLQEPTEVEDVEPFAETTSRRVRLLSAKASSIANDSADALKDRGNEGEEEGEYKEDMLLEQQQ